MANHVRVTHLDWSGQECIAWAMKNYRDKSEVDKMKKIYKYIRMLKMSEKKRYVNEINTYYYKMLFF